MHLNVRCGSKEVLSQIIFKQLINFFPWLSPIHPLQKRSCDIFPLWIETAGTFLCFSTWIICFNAQTKQFLFKCVELCDRCLIIIWIHWLLTTPTALSLCPIAFVAMEMSPVHQRWVVDDFEAKVSKTKLYTTRSGSKCVHISPTEFITYSRTLVTVWVSRGTPD